MTKGRGILPGIKKWESVLKHPSVPLDNGHSMCYDLTELAQDLLKL